MNDVSTADIRFFSLNSRIGRLRYLAYCIGLYLLMLIPIVLAVALASTVPILSSLLLVAIYVFLLVMGIGFGVRRLHDLDKSGWLILLMLVPLVNLGLLIYLLFFPGSAGENRFGAAPPANSGWVIAGAVAYIALIPVGGILAAIAIPAYQDFAARSQTSEAIILAGGGETSVAEYYNSNKAWPANLASVYAAAGQNPAGRYTATITGSGGSDGSYGIVATLQNAGVNSMVAGRSVEIWTRDNGQSWHCGPGGSEPLDARYLPASCRDSDAP